MNDSYRSCAVGAAASVNSASCRAVARGGGHFMSSVRILRPGGNHRDAGKPRAASAAREHHLADLHVGATMLEREHEVVPHHLDVAVHLQQVAGDRDLLDGVGEPPFDPEAARTAREKSPVTPFTPKPDSPVT